MLTSESFPIEYALCKCLFKTQVQNSTAFDKWSKFKFNSFIIFEYYFNRQLKLHQTRIMFSPLNGTIVLEICVLVGENTQSFLFQ